MEDKILKKFEEYTGQNKKEIKSWKIGNCFDLIQKYADEQEEAINLITCSTQLKSEDMIDFEEWKKRFVVHVKGNLFELRGSMLSSETLRFAYSKDIELYNSLIV